MFYYDRWTQADNCIILLKCWKCCIPQSNLKCCTHFNFWIFKSNLFFTLISLLSLRLYHYIEIIKNMIYPLAYNFECFSEAWWCNFDILQKKKKHSDSMPQFLLHWTSLLSHRETIAILAFNAVPYNISKVRMMGK